MREPRRKRVVRPKRKKMNKGAELPAGVARCRWTATGLWRQCTRAGEPGGGVGQAVGALDGLKIAQRALEKLDRTGYVAGSGTQRRAAARRGDRSATAMNTGKKLETAFVSTSEESAMVTTS